MIEDKKQLLHFGLLTCAMPRALRLVRNVLVRQGGIAEDIFVSEIQSTGMYSSVTNNIEVVISYKDESDFCGHVVSSANTLFIDVDLWLQSHPD